MATRGGPMVLGTDGADFEHRQRVAAHYQIRFVMFPTSCLAKIFPNQMTTRRQADWLIDWELLWPQGSTRL